MLPKDTPTYYLIRPYGEFISVPLRVIQRQGNDFECHLGVENGRPSPYCFANELVARQFLKLAKIQATLVHYTGEQLEAVLQNMYNDGIRYLVQVSGIVKTDDGDLSDACKFTISNLSGYFNKSNKQPIRFGQHKTKGHE